MKKNIFIIIITCITVFCIILGSYLHFGYRNKGIRKLSSTISRSVRDAIRDAKNDSLDYLDDDYDDEDYDDDEDESEDFSTWSKSDSEDLEAFSKIEINAKVMGITVERGNRYSIKTTFSNEKLRPAFTVSGGTLKVNQPSYKRRSLSVGNQKCSVVITLPFGAVINNLDVNVDVGALELDNIDITKGSINNDVGAVSIENVDFEDLNIHSDVGAVSVILMQPSGNYNMNIKSDVGGIQVDNKAFKRRYNQQGSSNKSLTIKTDVGGIEIK